jgi:WD40 repeat protein/serine/threonine protein kinase
VSARPPSARVRLTCPACGVSASAPSSIAGRSVRCAKCQHTFLAPEWPVAEPEPGDDAAPTVAEVERESAVQTARPRPAAPEWRTGQAVLGLYEVMGVLGQGGMGRVYRVRHRGWGVDLAVKAPLRTALEAAGGVEAFEREAETWVSLGLHPHVVSCYYVRRVDGIPRVFAEYVDGGSLLQALREHRLGSPARALDLAIQTAWGLDYAHDQGLVHRDVKPANVMLTSDGLAKVTDFGLAGTRVNAAVRGASGDQTTAAPGGPGATPAYMSPEQSAGAPLTRGTDVWSWAVSVLEMFLGRRDWEVGPAAGVAFERNLATPSEWAVALPAGAAELLRRCLSTAVEQRPRTLAQAAAALAEVYARETGTPYPRVRPDAGRDTADSLNNRAVSLLDLGRQGAETLWARALRADPQHLEATYNQALHQWAQGGIADEDLLSRVQAAFQANQRLPRAGGLLAQAQAACEGTAAADVVLVRLDGVQAMALSPDGQRVLASARGVAGVRVFGAGGQAQRPLATQDLRVKALAVLPGGQEALLGGEGAPPQVWDLEGTRPARALARFPGITNAVAASADGRMVAAAGSDRVVRVFDPATGALQHALEGHGEAVSCLAFDARGTVLVSGALDGVVRVWTMSGAQIPHTLAAHRGRVTAVALSRDGASLLTAGEDRALRVWDMESGAPLRTLLGPSGAVTGVLFSEDGREALSASLDRTLRVWDLVGGRLRSVFRVGAPASGLAGRADAPWVATSTGVRAVRLEAAPWQPPYAVARPLSAVEVERRSAAFLTHVSAARQAITQGDVAAALKRAREARAVPGHERSSEALTLWDEVTAGLPRGTLAAAWEVATLEGHTDPVLSIAVAAGGRRALSGDLAGTLRWWDLGQTASAGTLRAHEANVAGVALSPDGAVGVSASWDHTLKVWELGAGQEQRLLEGHEDYVNGVALSPSGRRVLSASSDHTLRLWDLLSGRELGVLAGHEGAVSACTFGPDGRFALSASWDGSVRLWDVEGRSMAGFLEGHEGGVTCVAVSPDGRQAVSGAVDGTLRTWDLRLRRALHVLEGHTSEVTSAAFLPDGRHLVSGARDKTVRVWDLEKGTTARVLPHMGAVLAAAVLPSGNGLLCGGTALALTQWRLDWEAAPAAARPTLSAAPRATVRVESPTAWEDIRRAAPRAAAREAAVQAAREARRRLPSRRVMVAGGLVAAAVAFGLLMLWPRYAALDVSQHQSKIAGADLLNDIEDLRPREECTEGYEVYLQRARERMVARETYGCLLRLPRSTSVDDYLQGLAFPDPEPTVVWRRQVNTVAYLAALGDEAVPAVCRWLREPDPHLRPVVMRALALRGTGPAQECLAEAATDADPEVRVQSAAGLRFLLARGAIDTSRGFELARALAGDADPRVRAAAVPLLGMFDFEHATKALVALDTDSDPKVVAAARDKAKALHQWRAFNPDRPY